MNHIETYRLGYTKAFDDLAERFADLGARHAALEARLADIEARQAELDAKSAIFTYGRLIEARATRRPYRAPTWEQQVAARVAEMEAYAAKSGRPEYRGGPVAWDDKDALAVAA